MSELFTRVVKVGGAHLDDEVFLSKLVERLARYANKPGTRLVLVHGGGKEIAELHRRLDLPFRKERGLRVTSAESMELVTMVLCGAVNKRVVARLNHAGVPTIGISGADMGLMRASMLNYRQLGRVGGAPTIAGDRLEQLLDSGLAVALAPVCLAQDGGLVNVNADAVAQAVAIALDAEVLDFVTDVRAVRTPTGYASELSCHQVESLVGAAVVNGGMIPKLQASVAAVAGGVSRVRVGTLESIANNTATEVHA